MQFAGAALLVAAISLRTVGELTAGLSLVFLAWSWRRQRTALQVKDERQVANAVVERTQELAGRTEETEEAARLKSESLANLGHEIRTPMSGILGSLELVFDTELTCEQRQYLQLTKSSAEILQSRIDDILEFAAMELDSFKIDRKEFALEACVRGAVMAIAGVAEQKQLVLRTEIGPGLPERIVGDPARLHQVLVRVVENAVKFSSRGEVVVKVEREPGTNEGPYAGEELRFAVQDQGIGIPAEKLDAIFHPFQQGDGSVRRRYAGNGLGLTICKRLVRLMGGRIWVESQEGQGSTFCFTIKLQTSGAGPGETLMAPGPTPQRTTVDRLQVLIVEDNPVNQLVTRRLMEARGFHCLEAHNGVEALEVMRTASVDLVIMDIQMPEMDGYEATRCIRELERQTLAHVPILALTAHALESDREKCLRAGMDGYATKPVQRHQLYEAVDGLLGVSH